MITVYFWSYKSYRTHVGHASVRIGVGQGQGLDTYVSWWPAGDGGLSEPGVPSSLERDLSEEGQPTGTVSIAGLDEAAMRRLWKHMLARNPGYAATRQNCAWVVKCLLDAGTGLDVHAAVSNITNMYWFAGIWTPRHVYDYARELRNRYERDLQRKNRFQDATNRSLPLRSRMA